MIKGMCDVFPFVPGEEAGKDVEKAYLFNVILQPNTSLQPRGFLLLMVAISSAAFVAGMIFMLLGAWPVLGFFGLEVALIYMAFKANYRWARTYETLRLSEAALVVERISPSGKAQRWRFQPYWLKVDIDIPAKHENQLVISSHGKRLKIGTFLTADERVELAGELCAALEKVRSPEHLREMV
tara:strand:- start:414 stop:962 length:549 start_codon:yes stop_codon:yes gene_type:complete